MYDNDKEVLTRLLDELNELKVRIVGRSVVPDDANLPLKLLIEPIPAPARIHFVLRVAGDTYPRRAELKLLGLRYSSERPWAWYYEPCPGTPAEQFEELLGVARRLREIG